VLGKKINIKKDIRSELKTRVLVMDGAMGSLIQEYKLTEADYYGLRLKDFPFDQKGNNDILSITHPEIIREIHTNIWRRALIFCLQIFMKTTFAVRISYEEFVYEIISYG
jgi:5-methyltetrahydrofolate--homocysteine methyltransferase